MHTFFHGWRRKTGVVALGLACVVMGLWIRSRGVVDAATFTDVRHCITNSPLGLDWSNRTGMGQVSVPQFLNMRWDTVAIEDSNFDSFRKSPPVGWETVWDYHCCGFQFAKFKLTGSPLLSLVYAEYATWTIPHWAVVLPLTLLSAYLLLWRPRKREA
jgi:hypothetical protein